MPGSFFAESQENHIVYGLRQLPWTPDYGTGMTRQLRYMERCAGAYAQNDAPAAVERIHRLINVLYHQGSSGLKAAIINLFVLPLYTAMLDADGAPEVA